MQGETLANEGGLESLVCVTGCGAVGNLVCGKDVSDAKGYEEALEEVGIDVTVDGMDGHGIAEEICYKGGEKAVALFPRGVTGIVISGAFHAAGVTGAVDGRGWYYFTKEAIMKAG